MVKRCSGKRGPTVRLFDTFCNIYSVFWKFGNNLYTRITTKKLCCKFSNRISLILKVNAKLATIANTNFNKSDNWMIIIIIIMYGTLLYLPAINEYY